MEDDSVQAFDDTVDERFYDERRERAQRRQRKRYHAVYVAPKWRAELPTTTNEEDSDDGEARVVSENGRRDVEQWRRTRVEAPWMRGCLK